MFPCSKSVFTHPNREIQKYQGFSHDFSFLMLISTWSTLKRKILTWRRNRGQKRIVIFQLLDDLILPPRIKQVIT